MDVLDSSRSSVGKTVSSLMTPDSSSSSKTTLSPKTPLPLPKSYVPRILRAHRSHEDEDGVEEYKRHHNALSLMFLLAVVTIFMMWTLDMCSLGFAKRMISRRPTHVYSRPPTSTPPPTNSVEVQLDGVATEAKNSVREFFGSAGNFQCPQPHRFTQDEVARHHTADDLWIVIDGNVLDLSSFVHQHPGGLVLLDGAGGQDMATVFARFHHPSSVGLFSSFCIGRVAG